MAFIVPVLDGREIVREKNRERQTDRQTEIVREMGKGTEREKGEREKGERDML